MDNRKVWKNKGFLGYKNQNPDEFRWIYKGTTYITNLKEMRAHDEWLAKRARSLGLTI